MKSLIALFLFLVSMGLIFWVAKPLWGESVLLRGEINRTNFSLEGLRSLETIRDDLLSTYNSISKPDLDKLGRVMPDNIDTGGLLVFLEKATKDRGIRLKQVEFQKNSDRQIVQKTPDNFNKIVLSFTVSASYESFKSLLDALEHSARTINVTNISFTVSQSNFFEFLVKANAYYAKPHSEPAGLDSLRNIKIDTSFFSDPEFLELEVFPSPFIEGVQSGRKNPFLPI